MAATNFPQTMGWGYTDPYAAEIEAKRKAIDLPIAPRLTPEEGSQRKALNEHDYQLGLLGMLSANDTLKQVGGQIFKQALAERQPRVTDQGEYNPMTGSFTYHPEVRRQRQQEELARLEQLSAAGYGRWEEGRQSAAERYQQAQMMALTAAMGRQQSSADAASRREDRKSDQRQQVLNKDIQELSKRSSELAPVLQSAGEVQKMLGEYGNRGIPGVGYEAMLGPLLPEQGVLNRAKIQAVANALLRAQSGQAVTMSEEARAATQNLASGRYSEREFRNNWPLLVETINSNVRNIRAGFDPEAVGIFEERGANFAPIEASSGFNPRKVSGTVTDDRRSGGDRRGGGAAPVPAGLTPDEAAEMAALKKQLGRR